MRMRDVSTEQTSYHASKSSVATNHTRPPFWTFPNGGDGLDHGPSKVARLRHHTHHY